MYQCPNCASNLKFDIKLQMMHCEYCGTDLDPYGVQEIHKVEEQVLNEESTDGETMQVTIYTCSQCGGEIIGDENEAATFCSFCGTSTIMNGRIDRAKRPAKIIPFSVTKDDCARAYKSLTAKAIFAPDYVKDPQKIDGFRGIYMPYWIYDFSKNGRIDYKGKHTYQKGDYEYTDHYSISSSVDMLYKGVEYDASSTFADELSNAIAPFDAKNPKEFTSAFMSGFYADVMDVNDKVYVNDAKNIVADHACSKIESSQRDRHYSIERETLRNSLKTDPSSKVLGMLPVWFMSYRTTDDKGAERVVYSVVNGQTGKCAADLPVDIKKYLIGSLLLAIPFFAIYSAVLTIRPISLMVVAAVIMLICRGIVSSRVSEVINFETGATDRGVQNKLGKVFTIKKESKADKKAKQEELNLLKSNLTKEVMGSTSVLFWISLIICVIFFFAKPVNDAFYYVSVILTGISDCLMLLSIVKLYNKTASRPLPQFKRQGGDDSANISRDI